MAQVTMSAEEYQTLIRAREDAIHEVAKIHTLLIEAKRNAAPSDARAIVTLVRHLLSITRFAVAQMPPEAHKGWPIQDLAATCDLLPKLPDFDGADQEVISAFRSFVQEITLVERIREGATTNGFAGKDHV